MQKVQEASDGKTDIDRNGGQLWTWQQIDEEAGPDTLQGYQLLDHSANEGQPRTAPTTVLASDESTTTDKPVLLYRDTNAWCPFCERVGISAMFCRLTASACTSNTGTSMSLDISKHLDYALKFRINC